MIRRLSIVALVLLASASVLAASGPQFVPDSPAGQMTPEQKQQIAKSFMSTLQLHPLVPRVAANGRISVELDDSMANVYLARVTDGGTIVFDCVNDPASAVQILTTPASESIMWRGAAAPSQKTPVVLEEK